MAISITQHHIFGVINTEILKKKDLKVVRILDMGCGNGQMIAFLQSKLQNLYLDLNIEVYGFDVSDSKVQNDTFFIKTIEFLKKGINEIEWKDRIFQITSKQEWPFPQNYFDFVVSNQVMEHIFDHNFSFQQIRKVLKIDGVSIHLFPLKAYLYEGHLFLPFVHWISNKDLLKWYIKFCSRLGLGKYKNHLKAGLTTNLNEFSQMHADYMIFETNYLNQREIYKYAKKNQLKCSFQYTKDFYVNKIRQIFRRPFLQQYSINRNFLWERILFMIFVRISCITLILEKNNSYMHKIN